MKDIKSIIIGLLLATCIFLFMGQTSNDESMKLLEQALADDFDREESMIGKYQIAGDMMNGLYLVDSETGKIWYWKRTSGWDYMDKSEKFND